MLNTADEYIGAQDTAGALIRRLEQMKLEAERNNLYSNALRTNIPEFGSRIAGRSMNRQEGRGGGGYPPSHKRDSGCLTVCKVSDFKKSLPHGGGGGGEVSGLELDCDTVCVEPLAERFNHQHGKILKVSCNPDENIVIDEDTLLEKTRLNGRYYPNADLVEYLYSLVPRKFVPHTGQELSSKQQFNILQLLSEEYPYIIAPEASDIAYATTEQFPLEGEDPIHDTVMEDTLRQAMMSCGEIDEQQYWTNAFSAFAQEIAMSIGMEYKPSINFGIARYLNVSGRGKNPAVMGRDLDVIAFLLEQSHKGVSNGETLDSITQRAKMEFPDVPQQELERYIVPWAYGMCCALEPQELLALKTNTISPQSLKQSLDSVVSSGTGGGPLTVCNQNTFGKSLIAPFLSDHDFLSRLSQADSDILASQAIAIPIDGPKTVLVSRQQSPGYTIYESNLAQGVPLAPPMNHSVAQKAWRISRGRPLSVDAADKGPSFNFVKNQSY